MVTARHQRRLSTITERRPLQSIIPLSKRWQCRRLLSAHLTSDAHQRKRLGTPRTYSVISPLNSKNKNIKQKNYLIIFNLIKWLLRGEKTGLKSEKVQKALLKKA